jgi:ATP-dependent RNA helicase RhlE
LSFSALQLDAALLRGVERLGFADPTPIQKAAIPPALAGRDVLACAMTGSGKTAAFVLPILQRLGAKPHGRTRALILTPTRELAAQIHEHLTALAGHTRVSAAAIFGGVGMGPQEQALKRGVDVVVATPGRLLDHLQYPYANLRSVEVLVLDEADRMLDMGFLPDVRRVLRHLPSQRQTLFFSATLPEPIAALSREMLKDPATIETERRSKPAHTVTQKAYPVAGELKSALLAELVKRGEVRSVIAFTRTKHRANRLADFLLRSGVSAERIHGNRSQVQRTETLRRFKAGAFPVLVATDIAARGIDVEALSHVVNFDVPMSPEDYVHRVGRTGRMEATGDALVFVSPAEESQLRDIERAIGARVPRVTLPGFDYTTRPKEGLEIPAAQRMAEFRARKQQERMNAARKAARRVGQGAGQGGHVSRGAYGGQASHGGHGRGDQNRGDQGRAHGQGVQGGGDSAQRMQGHGAESPRGSGSAPERPDRRGHFGLSRQGSGLPRRRRGR